MATKSTPIVVDDDNHNHVIVLDDDDEDYINKDTNFTIDELLCDFPVENHEITNITSSKTISSTIVGGSYKAIEANTSELIGSKFSSETAAYSAYNQYAFRKGFGIRLHTLRKNVKGNVICREMVCNKHGLKEKKGCFDKKYTKLDRRTGCKAMVVFKVIDDQYVCTDHKMEHNHTFCHLGEVHHLRSHRSCYKSEAEYLIHLKSSGIRLSDAVRSMVKEAGGSPNLGFRYDDAFTAVKNTSGKQFDKTDCNALVQILKKRAATEEDFYYDFELDVDNRLISFFFRDKKMKEDYELFYEVVGNDGTYCTNKYDMVAAPFVGINHHTRICMFGIGFMLNESITSYNWLYKTFLVSMGGLEPRTIMTDQSSSMSSAIVTCFPNSKHRLCIWHIFKNSAGYLGHLKDHQGFNKLFSRIMKRCHTDAELNYCWERLMTEYNCRDHVWLNNLFKVKEKWCCAYGKDHFSAGILSSQRSESTNNSLCRRLSKTTSLCDFYEVFGSVVTEWRSHERRDNSQCWDGVCEVLVPCALLKFASQVYTIAAYKRFEKEFVKGMAYKHRLETTLDSTQCYYVYPEHDDEFGHSVMFDSVSHLSSCTCKRFEEGGFLCRHILRIYHITGVDIIPSVYVLKRWTRDAKPKDDICVQPRGNLSGPVWKLDMHRQFHKLIVASSANVLARDIINTYFQKAKNEVEAIIGGVYLSDVECNDAEDVIQNPDKRTKKGERFKRKRSVIDVETSRARGRFKASETRARKRGAAVSTATTTGHRRIGLREIIMNN